MWFVAPSFRGKPFLCEPYERDGKWYTKIQGAAKPREIRCYDEWQKAWGTAEEPRTEVKGDKFLVFNYPEDWYGKLIGIREGKNGRGIWWYENQPKNYRQYSHSQLWWNIPFGFFCHADVEPIEELQPKWISESELRVDGGWRRLVLDYGVKNEID